MAALGLANAADSAELMVISFVMPQLPFTDTLVGILSGSMFFGMIVGGIISGSLADRYGRKNILLGFMTLNLMFGMAVVALPDVWQWIFACRTIAGVGVGGTVPVMFAMAAESVAAVHRSFFISVVCTYWLVGGLYVAGVSWYILGYLGGSWTYAVALSQAPNLIAMIMIAGLMYETPGFYASRGDHAKALKVASKMAEFSKRRTAAEDGEADGLISGYDAKKSPPVVNETFDAAASQEGFSEYRYQSGLFFVQWSMLSFGWYGIVLWIPRLFKEYGATYGVYEQSFLVQCSNIPGLIACAYLISRVNSSLLLAVSMLASCVVCTVMGFMSDLTVIVSLACLYNAVSIMGWNCLSESTAQAYPTHLRSTALGTLSAVGKLFSGSAEVTFGVMFSNHVSPAAILFVGAATMMLGAVSGFLLYKHRQKGTAKPKDSQV
eukprot:TRINITY_DN2950_c0_g3_i1.p1 TRINITY_DN2950_c0_g3~~TRINITY_DN2950_c0_g3_i1.p1  ORF type:complete len:494 (+),score=162.56 TRINITY_DN2950_c0_g3_i1:175-1482(+)